MLEFYDTDGQAKALWEQVKAVTGDAVRARILEARKAFPDIPFDVDAPTNTAVFRHICQFYLDNQKKP